MTRLSVAIAALAAVTSIAHSQTQQGASVRPKQGFIPNAETALKVGEAVLIPVYGQETILSERPLKATLEGDVWLVEGTLHCEGPAGTVCKGGTAIVKLSKASGQILFMTHSK